MEIKGIKYISPCMDNCYDDQTEVLTDYGWKFFCDIRDNDKICTLNKEHYIEYHEPDDIIFKDYNGDMYHFFSVKSCIDLLVTPNHNMYVQTDGGRKTHAINTWKLEPASFIHNKSRYFKKNAFYNQVGVPYIDVCGTKLKTEDWLEFLGYYLSEGSSTITKEKHYIVQIRQFGQHLHKMAAALDKITSNKINIKEQDGRVIVNDKTLCLYLKTTFGDKYDKHIPREILNGCSRDQLIILFDALMLGDGHDLRGRVGGGGSSYNTSSARLRDDFMELLLKIGYSGSYIRVYEKGSSVKVFDRTYMAKADNWTIRIRFNNNKCFKGPATNFTCEKINYSGKIGCVSVKNHVIYVRRNGSPVWSGNSGYAQASRGNILALHKLGVPITLSPISFEAARPDLGKDGEILTSLIDKEIDYNFVVIQTTPEFWKKYRENDKINVGMTIWETTKLHSDWPDLINNGVDKCLVSCDWNADVFKESGVTIPVGVVPYGIEMNSFTDVTPYTIGGIKDNTFVFYEICQWTERKGLTHLLKAYWLAFQDREDVALVIKTYRSDYSEPEKDAVRNTISRLKYVSPLPKGKTHAPIYLVLDMLSNNEMLGLHKRGDCYVSLNRGEGWGMSPFAAGACGNPVITTGFGGVLAFAKPDNSYLVDYQLTPVWGMPWSPWYALDQNWAEPNVCHAAEVMRYVYENRDEAKQRGLKMRDYILNNLTWECAGRKLIEELKNINL